MKSTTVFPLIFFLLLVSCASLQSPVMLGTETGEKHVSMQASSFKFVPNNIKARQGDIVNLSIENTSGATHNFTMKDPQGHEILSVNLPPHKTADVKFNLDQEGTYEFYCNKPLHSLFGMKGQIEVS